MTLQKPDGTIEFGYSACCCPPGPRRPGQHTNCTTTWFRTNGGEWRRLVRQTHVNTLARAAETVAEFEAALIEKPEPEAGNVTDYLHNP
jgi:hypothetical protein